VTLDRLPLTPNGKVDRKALPMPGETRTKAEPEAAAPRTSVEQTITAIWRELLQVSHVGVNDNFFDLGGHSLLVVEAQARIQQALGIELLVVRLFQYPTIRALAKFLSAGAAPAASGNADSAPARPVFRRLKPKTMNAA
jgi:acyl carrier protein